ncbi:MAG: hypothetical protein ACRETI_00100 [Steroidobacteraceae bacterium]
MKSRDTRPALAVLFSLALLSACTATRLTTQAQLPPPLIDKAPGRVGIHYSKEFREYVHRETRGTIDYEVTLGPAHVTNLDWLLKAMFTEIVPVEDPTRVASLNPPLLFVLEPKFEEYSFLTPKDVAGEAFIVTIRYLLTLYDGSGGRVDSFTYTGYGREKARTLASKEPLQVATQRAMRDAGAKVAVELTDQEAVRLLIRNAGLPAPPPPASAPASVTPAVGSAPEKTPPAEEPPAEAPSPGEPPEEKPPADELPDDAPEVETRPAAPPAEEEPPPSGSGA